MSILPISAGLSVVFMCCIVIREDTTILDGSIPRVGNYKNVKVLKKFCLDFHYLAEKILS